MVLLVALPTSRSQVDKLGKRLVAEGHVAAEDRELFIGVLNAYQQLLDGVTETLEALGLRPTSRVKTTGTLIEKLQREHGIQLTRINDIAGARVVVDGNRLDQDEVVARIEQRFADCPRGPIVRDRRLHPNHGYRAVHVIVFPESTPVEIQVRTALQDSWAQIFERLADQWGRQIRYGGDPSSPRPGESASLSVRFNIVTSLQKLSRDIDLLESAGVTRLSLVKALASLDKLFKDTASHLREIAPEKADSDVSGSLEAQNFYLAMRERAVGHITHYISDRRVRNRIIRRNLPRARVSPDGLVLVSEMVGRILMEKVVQSQVLEDEYGKLLRRNLSILAKIQDGDAGQ